MGSTLPFSIATDRSGLVYLKDLIPTIGEEACEPGAVGTRTLDAERVDLSQVARPSFEFLVPQWRRARASHQVGHLARQGPQPHAGPYVCPLPMIPLTVRLLM